MHIKYYFKRNGAYDDTNINMYLRLMNNGYNIETNAKHNLLRLITYKYLNFTYLGMQINQF